MNEDRKVLVTVGKLFDREYKFMPLSEVEKINEGKEYKNPAEALKDKECDRNAIVVNAIPIKNKIVEIYVGSKHKSVEHTEVNVPIYVAETKNKETGEISRVITDLESMPTLNNEYESVVNTTLLEIPDDVSIYMTQILFGFISAKASISEDIKEVRLDENIFTTMNPGDTMYSLASKLMQLI